MEAEKRERQNFQRVMPGIGKNSEAVRIMEVYKSYREDTNVAKRWSQENPGNRIILLERRLLMRKWLETNGFFPLTDKVILDVGCGYGRELSVFLDWGARAENIYGVDLLPDRIEAARLNLPNVQLDCRNAESLHYKDDFFHIILLFTVLSSIMEDAMARKIAAESIRVLRPGGAIIWYDMRYNNPSNHHIQGIRKNKLNDLFEGLDKELMSITPYPPILRGLGRLAPALYPVLSKLSFLHTHYFGLFYKRVPEP